MCLHRCRILHDSFLNFMRLRFLSSHFSTLLQSVCMATQTSNVSHTSPSFLPSLYLLSAHWYIFQVINEDIEQYWYRINRWGTPLTTGLQLDFVLLIIPLSSAVHFSVHLTIHSSSPHFISFSLRTLQEVKEYCVKRLTKI